MLKALKGALVVALLGSTEKVSLVCEGTAGSSEFHEKPALMSVVIDLNGGTMETSLGVRRENIILCLDYRMAGEPTLGVVPLRRLAHQGGGLRTALTPERIALCACR
jgi:hypothetical protein